jgi:hypothetical protein
MSRAHIEPAAPSSKDTPQIRCQACAPDATSSQVRCPHTGVLSGRIAGDAATLVDLIQELIGNGSSDSNVLACMQACISRIGIVADTLARTHGGEPLASSAQDWLLVHQVEVEAFNALESIACSTSRGGSDADRST